MTALDSNSTAERLHDARESRRERDFAAVRDRARLDLISDLMRGETVGRGVFKIWLAEILEERVSSLDHIAQQDAIDIAKALALSAHTPDSRAPQELCERLCGDWIDRHPGLLESRAEELMEDARDNVREEA